MTYTLAELEEIEDRDLSSEEERKKVGQGLMRTVQSGDQRECIKSAKILLENNMSYYIYDNRELLYGRITKKDGYSVKYSIMQLVKFGYEDNREDETLSDIIISVLKLDEDILKEHRGYSTKQERIYETGDVDLQKISKNKFGEEFQLDRGEPGDIDKEKRIELKDSGKGGLVRKTDEYVEFEIYERVGSKSVAKSRGDIEDFYNSVEVCYDILEDVSRRNPEALTGVIDRAVQRVIDISREHVGKLGKMSLKTLSKISKNLEKDKKEQVIDVLISRIQDGFGIQPNDMLLDYIIRSEGDIPRKEDVSNAIKKEYDISESPQGLLKYESDSEVKRAYSCLGLMRGKKSWKITMINIGFTQFLHY